MNRKQTVRPRARKGRFVPRLEELEDRRLLAIAVACAGDTVTFTGDAGPDYLVVNDNGAGLITGSYRNGAGDVVPFVPCVGIRQINISTGAGNDNVTYNLNGNLAANAARVVNADLGDGNDFLLVNAYGRDVAAGATLALNLRGGEGLDSVYVIYRGEVDGQLRLDVDGGGGSDRVYADLKLDCGSSGAVAARVRGGPGNDVLELYIRELCPPDPTSIQGVVMGEADFDTCTHTANVAGHFSNNIDNVVIG